MKRTPVETAPEGLDQGFAVPFVHRLRFTRDVLGAEREVLAGLIEPSGERRARVQFWVDSQVAETNPGLLEALDDFGREFSDRLRPAGIHVTAGGEGIKNDLQGLEVMLRAFHDADLDRRSYVVVIGGGAVLDAVGFAAAIAHRGIRLIRLPTTTLAQADSGVGVKNAVNLFGKKNWLGTFAVPWGVVNDEALLASLPDRDFRCGFSEAVKVALLKDARVFEQICQEAPAIARREREASSSIIRASVELHLAHITRGGDPFEALEARPLDFGHWSAHKMEPLSGFALRHGEAVAIGVAIDSVYSSLVLGLPESDAERVLRCLADLGFPLDDPTLDEPERLFQGLEEFRQHLGGRLTLTMLEAPGRPIDVHEVERGAMVRAIARVREFGRTRTGPPVGRLRPEEAARMQGPPCRGGDRWLTGEPRSGPVS